MMSDIEPFLPGTVPFSQHLEQLDWIFAHHKITDSEEKKITFLASCNTEVFSELKLLFPDRDLKRVPYTEICNALCRRYDTSESMLRRRFKFYRREQGPSESAEGFIRAVKQLADRCEFGSFKHMAIRDRLVCGISDRDLQKRLLEKNDPTLSEIEQLISDEDLLGPRHESTTRSSIGGDRYKPKTQQQRPREPKPKDPPVVHVSSGGGSSRSRERSRRRTRTRSRSPRPRLQEPAATGAGRKVMRCTFCDREGHTFNYCFKRRNKQNAHAEPKRNYSNNGRDYY